MPTPYSFFYRKPLSLKNMISNLDQFVMILWLVFVCIWYTSGSGAEINSPEDIKETYLLPVVQNGLLRFMIRLNRLLLEDTDGKENIVFSPINIYELAVLVAIRTNGLSRIEICQMLEIPRNIETMKAQKVLKKLLEYVHRHSSEDYSSGRLSWKDGLQLKDWRVFFPEKLNESNVIGSDIVTELVQAWIGTATSKDPSVLKAEMAQVIKLIVSSPIYFHESWKGVQINLSRRGPFNTDDRIIPILFLSLRKELPYVKNDHLKFEAISIPYENRHFAFYIILPDEGYPLTSLVDNFDETCFTELVNSLYTSFAPVDLRIPSLKFKWARQMNSYVQKLGAAEIFSRIIIDRMVTSLQLSIDYETVGAQLSLGDFFLPRVYRTLSYDQIPSQKIKLQEQYFPDHFNQSGTRPIPFHVNRPFMFFIYNHNTKIVLFSGLVKDPSKVKIFS